MNDVVIYYSSTVVKDKSSNALVRTTTTFTPMNDGATYTNGFGFQLDYRREGAYRFGAGESKKVM